MSLLSNPIDRGVSELRTLQNARAKLEAEALADSSRLQELRGKIGDAELAALLDGSDASPIRREISELQVRIAGREAARPKLAARIRQAAKSLAHARAEAVRARIAPIQRKLDEHQQETLRLLEALQKHAGVRYQQQPPQPPPGVTMWLQSELPSTPMFPALKLAMEISELRAEADRIEQEAEAGQIPEPAVTEIRQQSAA